MNNNPFIRYGKWLLLAWILIVKSREIVETVSKTSAILSSHAFLPSKIFFLLSLAVLGFSMVIIAISIINHFSKKKLPNLRPLKRHRFEDVSFGKRLVLVVPGWIYLFLIFNIALRANGVEGFLPLKYPENELVVSGVESLAIVLAASYAMSGVAKNRRTKALTHLDDFI
jgi:hypothetical protein